MGSLNLVILIHVNMIKTESKVLACVPIQGQVCVSAIFHLEKKVEQKHNISSASKGFCLFQHVDYRRHVASCLLCF